MSTVDRKPYDLHVWSGWRDSNPRPPAPKSAPAGRLTELHVVQCGAYLGLCWLDVAQHRVMAVPAGPHSGSHQCCPGTRLLPIELNLEFESEIKVLRFPAAEGPKIADALEVAEPYETARPALGNLRVILFEHAIPAATARSTQRSPPQRHQRRLVLGIHQPDRFAIPGRSPRSRVLLNARNTSSPE
jgi:hypothetical protein